MTVSQTKSYVCLREEIKQESSLFYIEIILLLNRIITSSTLAGHLL